MKVGLYFGTFNPIHVGHLVIANYMADMTDMDEIWLVVSPQNPLKKKSTLLADYHRLALVNEAIAENSKLKASDIEFKLPMPSYTTTPLVYLKEKYPEKEFALIMGEDNLRTFHKWKNHEVILENHAIYVYPRALTEVELESHNVDSPNDFRSHSNVHFCNDVPVMKISSSFIRRQIKEGKDVQYLLTEPVLKYLTEMNFYK
jgi:nicotinate-nucleotide adenylyltransferase